MLAAACVLLLRSPVPLGIAHADLVLKDGARSKEIEVRVTYPTTGGPYPLIVFSHGLGGSREAYRPLVDHWVEHGYVVIQPTHADAFKNLDATDRRKLLTRSGKPVGDAKQRPADVAFCLDSVSKIESSAPGAKGKIDTKRIGMGGHSYGAWTTMMLGGTKLFAGRFSTDMSDPRPKCLLLLSPQGTGPGLTKESFATMTRPTMTISGTEDRDPFSAAHEPVWRTEPYQYQPKDDKWLVWIEGATHALGGVSGRFGPGQDKKMLASVRLATLSFWDIYLKGSGKMSQVTSPGLTKVAGHKVTVSRK